MIKPLSGDRPQPKKKISKARRQQKRDLRQARDLTRLEYGPQKSAIRGSNRTVRNNLDYVLGNLGVDRRRDVRTQNRFGNQYDNRLQQIYRALNQNLNTGLNRQAQAYDSAGQEIKSNNAAALAAITGAGTSATNNIAEVAKRLGLEEGVPSAIGDLQAQMAGAEARTKAGGLSALSSHLSRGADVKALGLDQIMSSRREGAQARADLVSEVLGNIGNLQSDYAREAGDARHSAMQEIISNQRQLNNIGQLQGTANRVALREVKERNRQKSLDELASEIQRGTLDLQRDQLGHNISMDEAELDLARDKFSLDKIESRFNRAMAIKNDKRAQEQHQANLKQMEAALQGETLSPAERAYLRQRIAKTKAEINKIKAQTKQINAETGKDLTNFGRGESGVNKFLEYIGADNKFKIEIYDIIDSTNFPGGGLDAARREIRRRYKVPGPNREKLFTAINIFFGKY